MKTLALVAFTAAALAVPTLASAAEQGYYYNPPDDTFVAGTLNVAPTPNADAARYVQTVTFYDPANNTFETTKVGTAPVIGTHDAVKTGGTVMHFYDPANNTFADVTVGH